MSVYYYITSTFFFYTAMGHVPATCSLPRELTISGTLCSTWKFPALTASKKPKEFCFELVFGIFSLGELLACHHKWPNWSWSWCYETFCTSEQNTPYSLVVWSKTRSSHMGSIQPNIQGEKDSLCVTDWAKCTVPLSRVFWGLGL